MASNKKTGVFRLSSSHVAIFQPPGVNPAWCEDKICLYQDSNMSYNQWQCTGKQRLTSFLILLTKTFRLSFSWTINVM